MSIPEQRVGGVCITMGLPLPIPLGRSPPSPSLLPSPPRAEQHYLRSRKRANLEVEGVGGRGKAMKGVCGFPRAAKKRTWSTV